MYFDGEDFVRWLEYCLPSPEIFFLSGFALRELTERNVKHVQVLRWHVRHSGSLTNVSEEVFINRFSFTDQLGSLQSPFFILFFFTD